MGSLRAPYRSLVTVSDHDEQVDVAAFIGLAPRV
jgi:hypothetical protein